MHINKMFPFLTTKKGPKSRSEYMFMLAAWTRELFSKGLNLSLVDREVEKVIFWNGTILVVCERGAYDISPTSHPF